MNYSEQKMSRPLLLILLAALGWLAGCTKSEPVQTEEVPTKLELFSKTKGLQLPPDMLRTLGVATVEITPRAMARRMEVRAQVYQAAAGGNRASAVAWLDESASKELREGQAIALPAPAAGGTLARLHQAAAGLAGEVEAVIIFDDPTRHFSVGESFTATFLGATNHTALAVPESAVIPNVAGSFVYVANGKNFVRTFVKTRAAADGWVEITDGLYEGDTVVTRATEALWLIELCAVRGGTPCCPVGRKPNKD